ncbi:MAG: tetratricopeptide repeat protein [Acidobacteria bacterium]|nr:tetratricopeptide repeat protein [Acidobacteriota bacterium]
MAMSKCWYFSIIIATVAAAGCATRIPAIQKLPVAAEDAARAGVVARDGDLLISRGETYAALLKYLDAVKLDPYSEVFHNKLAIAYTKLNYYDRALEAIRRSLGLSGQYPYGYNTLGTIQMLQGKRSAALRSFQRAIHLSPGNAFFYLNLASAHLEKNEGDKAMEALRQALALDPEVLTRQGGIGVQSASVQFSGSNQNYFLARLYAERGQDQRALDFLRKALSAGFTDVEKLWTDREFEKLRETQEFKDLLEEFGITDRPRPGRVS